MVFRSIRDGRRESEKRRRDIKRHEGKLRAALAGNRFVIGGEKLGGKKRHEKQCTRKEKMEEEERNEKEDKGNEVKHRANGRGGGTAKRKKGYDLTDSSFSRRYQ